MRRSFGFFLGYYRKKYFGTLSREDLFWKHFYRMHRKVAGQLLESSDTELLYKNQEIVCAIRKLHSDIHVYAQVFGHNEYLPLVQLIQKHSIVETVVNIIDAGANVGYTTLYFKKYFPDSHIVAVEPDAANAEQIRRNLTRNAMKTVDIVEGGVWDKDAYLELVRPGTNNDDWAFSVRESQATTPLKGYSFKTLLQHFELNTVDILKLDVEGTEQVLFADESFDDVLKNVRFIALEIHDNVADRKHIHNVLRSVGFEIFEQGELTIGANRRLLP